MKKEIYITLKTIDDALCPFSREVLSETLESYINRACTFVLKEEIELAIQGSFTNKEKQQLEQLIHQHYYQKKEQLKRLDHLDDLKRIFLFFLGIIFFLFASMLQGIFSETLLVAGWVAIWEMVYDLLFMEGRRKRQYHLYKALSTCKILFL